MWTSLDAPSDRCRNCGRDISKHLGGGRCPFDTHVVIDAKTIERATRTGHPRLLKNLLAGRQSGLFAGVEITGLRVTSGGLA